MKMIASVNFAKAERELRLARPYGIAACALFEKLELEKHVPSPSASASESTGSAAPSASSPVYLMPLTSDRGLCGAVHSTITRSIRAQFLEKPAFANRAKFIAVGDKSKQQMQRYFGGKFQMHFSEVGRKPLTFADASLVASVLLAHGFEQSNDPAIVYYNYYRSPISYKTMEMCLYPTSMMARSPHLSLYDDVDANSLQSFREFQLAAQIFYALREAAASEWSARMTAMDNATKNAGEMIDKLTIWMNRTRQAAITKELIDIVVGAAAQAAAK